MSINLALISILILQIKASYIADPPNFEKGVVTGNDLFWAKKIYGHYYVTRDRKRRHSENHCNGEGGRYAIGLYCNIGLIILNTVRNTSINPRFLVKRFSAFRKRKAVKNQATSVL